MASAFPFSRNLFSKPLSFALGVFLAVLSSAGCGDENPGTIKDRPHAETCETTSLNCGIHGTCSEASGSPECICQPGYGGVECMECAPGYQDNDGDGKCLQDCTVTAMRCGVFKKCDDSSGQVSCVDDEEALKNSCAATQLDCGSHGSCDDARGQAECLCKEGYAGERCAACAEGWQDNDGDGICSVSCELANLKCARVESCQDDDGTAQCVVDPNADDWTVMVYLDADNNLGAPSPLETQICADGTQDCGGGDFQDMVRGMAAAGSAAGKVNLIVLYDQSQYSTDPSTRLYRITPQGAQKVETGEEIFSGTDANMSLPSTLRKFGYWAITHYPAKKYALILWDHGGGWRSGGSEGLLKNTAYCGHSLKLLDTMAETMGSAQQGGGQGFRDFATDETNGVDSFGQTETIAFANGEFRNLMEELIKTAGKKIDLLGFDACLMGMYEVAAASAFAADYMLGSSESEFAGEWAYATIIETLARTPSMTAPELGKLVADTYWARRMESAASEGDYYANVTMALYDLSQVSALQTKLDDFGHQLADAVQQQTYRTVVDEIAEGAQRFGWGEHADLQHVALLTKENASRLPQALADAADALLSELPNTVTYFKGRDAPDVWGYSHSNAHGMSLFFPREVNCKYYIDVYSYLYDYYKDDYTLSVYPCVYYPAAPANRTGNYSRTDLNKYLRTTWSSGWNNFLRNYL